MKNDKLFTIDLDNEIIVVLKRNLEGFYTFKTYFISKFLVQCLSALKVAYFLILFMQNLYTWHNKIFFIWKDSWFLKWSLKLSLLSKKQLVFV